MISSTFTTPQALSNPKSVQVSSTNSQEEDSFKKNLDDSKKGGKNKEPKIPDLSLVMDLVSILNRTPVTRLTPAPLCDVPLFPYIFKVYKRQSSNDVVIVQIINNTAYIASHGVVLSKLVEFIGRMGGILGVYASIKASLCPMAVTVWSNSSIVSQLPTLPDAWGLSNDPKVVFNRFGYEILPCSWDDLKEKVPEFTAMIDSSAYAPLLLQWIGSLLVKGSDRKQLIWFMGTNRDVLIKVLNLLLPHSNVSICASFLNSPFLMARFVGKRLVTINCTYYKNPSLNLVASTTLHDTHLINPKFGREREEFIDSKFIFTSDQPAPLLGDIFQFKIEGGDVNIDSLNNESIGMIAGYCIDAYRNRSKTTAIDENSPATLLDSHHNNIFLKLFTHNPDGYIPCEEFKETLTKAGLNKKEADEFLAWMLKKYPEIYKKRVRTSTTRVRAYWGITN